MAPSRVMGIATWSDVKTEVMNREMSRETNDRKKETRKELGQNR
jgi:hypothetical protein